MEVGPSRASWRQWHVRRDHHRLLLIEGHVDRYLLRTKALSSGSQGVEGASATSRSSHAKSRKAMERSQPLSTRPVFYAVHPGEGAWIGDKLSTLAINASRADVKWVALIVAAAPAVLYSPDTPLAGAVAMQPG